MYVVLNLPAMLGFQEVHCVHSDSVFFFQVVQSDLMNPYLEVILLPFQGSLHHPKMVTRNCRVGDHQGTFVPIKGVMLGDRKTEKGKTANYVNS